MPRAVHRALTRAGKKKGYRGERLRHFVFGTMTNMEKRRRKRQAAQDDEGR